jgi:tetratricopeptide (TPR) repeat protein
MNAFRWFWILGVLWIGAGFGEDPVREIEDGMKGLGAERFQEREAASLWLWEAGHIALPALRAAADSPDPEVRHRVAVLLRQITSGLRPGWPQDLQRQVENMRNLTEAGRRAVYARFEEQGGEEEVSFLLARLRFVDKDLAEERLKVLVAGGEAAQQLVVERLRDLRNETEPGVFAAVALVTKRIEDLVDALAINALSDADREALVRAGVEVLIGLYGERDFTAMRKHAGLLIAVAPDDTRIQLLKSVAVGHLGEQEAATSMLERAIRENRENETLLYRDAELMMEINHLEIAMALWGEILEMPPKGGYYDVQAYLRFGEAYQRRDEPAKAAISFQMGLDAWRELPAKQQRTSLRNSSEKELEERIEQLTARAAEQEKVPLEIEIDPENPRG